MTAAQRRLALWAVLGGSVLVGLFFAFRPQAVPVDMLTVERGELVVTVNEEGETRVRDVFILSAPVAGRMLRVEAEAGDNVQADQTVLAEIEPVDPTFLDFRSVQEAVIHKFAIHWVRRIEKIEKPAFTECLVINHSNQQLEITGANRDGRNTDEIKEIRVR